MKWIRLITSMAISRLYIQRTKFESRLAPFATIPGDSYVELSIWLIRRVWNEVIEITKPFLITSANAIYNLEILAGHNTGKDLIYMPKSDVYNTKYLNCFNQAVKWDDSVREQYHSILKQADSV